MAEKLQIVIDGDASKLIAELKKSGVGIEQLGGKAKNAGGGFKVFTNDLSRFIGPVGLIGLAAGAAKGVFELSKLGAESEAVGRAFENLSGNALAAQQNMLAMDAATRDLISDTDKQKIANQLLGMQIVSNAAELEKVVGVSRRLGKEFRGMGAADAANEFAVMMSNMSVQRLDSFGISSGAVRARIDELMASVQGMTREQAFFQATMEQADDTLARLGPEATTSAEAMQGLSAEWQDFLSYLGTATENSGAVSGFFGALASGINDVKTALGGGEASERIAEIKEELAGLQEKKDAGDFGFFAQFTKDTSGLAAELDNQIADLSAELATLEGETQANEAAMREEASALAAAEAATLRYAKAVQIANAQEALDTSISKRRGKVERVLYDRADEMGGADSGAIARAQERIAAEANAAEVVAGNWRDAQREMADNLRSEIENQIKPTLSEVWKPGGDDARIDEWGRRAATIMTEGLGSEWIGRLDDEFGSTDWYAPIQAALESGDTAGAQNMLGNILANNPSMFWDEAAVIAKLDQQLAQEADTNAFIDRIMAHYSGAGQTVDMGMISAAMGIAPTEGEGGKGGTVIDMAPTAAGTWEAFQVSFLESAEGSDTMGMISGIWAQQAALVDMTSVANVLVAALVIAVQENFSFKNTLVTIIEEDLVARGALNNPRTGR
uniref:Putative tail protein n=1 Tax=viral metagenome TaxID=1070528 RepID=A0A6M3LBU9_9ZZZZ